MPSVKSREKSSDYIHRAVPQMMGEGLTKKQALGKAYGMFREKWQSHKGFKKAINDRGKQR